MTNTRIPNFYNLSPNKRLDLIAQATNLNAKEQKVLSGLTPLSIKKADRMIENVIGFISIPLGVAANFKVNNKDIFVPMATEEPSVIAAASHAAKLAYETGGFFATSTGQLCADKFR